MQLLYHTTARKKEQNKMEAPTVRRRRGRRREIRQKSKNTDK
jgi:hypothetical protein